MAHYYFLDESGDPGFGGVAGSSSHFALAMTQLAARGALPALSAARQALHLPTNFEFKYYKASDHQKAIFFQAIQLLPFRTRAVVIEKAKLDKHFAQMNGQSLTIEFITRLTLRASEMDIANDVLLIDGATFALLRALRIRLSAECRLMNRVRPFRKITSGDSRGDDGLQLADMIVGAIRECFAEDDSRYYQTFTNKVLDLWEAPAQGK